MLGQLNGVHFFLSVDLRAWQVGTDSSLRFEGIYWYML